jgi:hypothetical protein
MHHLLDLHSITNNLMKMIVVARPTTFLIWSADRGLFLDNADQRVVYALQEFHSLFQGELSINDYLIRLKELGDLLRDVGHPVSDPSMVVNALLGLNSKFSHAISVLTARKPLPTFLYIRDYLLQDKVRQAHTAKMEAASTLLATNSSAASVPQQASVKPPASYSPNKKQNPNNKKGKQNGGKKKTSNNNGGSGTPPSSDNIASQASWGPGYNPWTGMVQAWLMPIWRPSGQGLLGPQPPNFQQAMMASSFPAAPDGVTYNNMTSTPPGLLAALQGVPPPSQYNGGGDWVMDTGASAHMANQLGILSSLSPPPIPSHIVVGNGAPLSVQFTGSTVIPTNSSPLKLNHVLISSHLIKNLISVRALTRDNFVSVTFDPFGFSIKDLQTGTVLLRCDSTGDLYPLRTSSKTRTTYRSFLTSHNTELWHARLGHPGNNQLKHIISSFDFQCFKSDNHSCNACQLGKHVRLPFSNSSSLSLFPFQLLHCDVWTSPIISNSGFRFYLVIMDDFSHFTWTFPMCHKSDVLPTLISFHAFIATQFQ